MSSPLAKRFEDLGVESIIYTDIGRDGMLSGINIEATVKLSQAVRIPVIASAAWPVWPTLRPCAPCRTKASKA